MDKKEHNKRLEEHYKRLWACRDFALSHLWQRSIFLTAFLVVILIGYGTMWLNVLTRPLNPDIKDYITFHRISIFISMLGIIFSILWILMAKGSKYWYEAYEEEIGWIESSTEYKNYSCQGVFSENTDKSLFLNKKGFKYSVSGINIAIGQIMAILWFLILPFHILFSINIDFLDALSVLIKHWWNLHIPVWIIGAIVTMTISALPFIFTLIICSFVKSDNTNNDSNA